MKDQAPKQFDCPDCKGSGKLYEGYPPTHWPCRRCDQTGKVKERRKPDDRLKEAEGLIARVRDRINNHAGYFPPYFRSELLAFLEQEEK